MKNQKKIRTVLLVLAGMVLFVSAMFMIVNSARTWEVRPDGGTLSPRVAATGDYLFTIGVTGVSGSDNAHFARPFGVAVNATGYLYVTDFDNYRVQVFDKAGIYKYTIGTGSGTGNYQFDKPAGVAVNATGHLYVTDFNNHRVQVFDSAGNYKYTIGVTGVPGADNAHFNYPEGVAVNATGHVYVADRSNHRVQVFDSAGNYKYTIGMGSGTGNYQFNNPKGAAVNATGHVYIADADNHRVQVFDKAGVYQYTIGVSGTGGSDNDHLNQPKAVAVNTTTGLLYVADFANHRMQVFDKAGIYQQTIGVSGTSGSTNNKLYYPTGVAIDTTGHLYVADQSNHRVQVFNPQISSSDPIPIELIVAIVVAIAVGVVGLVIFVVRKRNLASGQKPISSENTGPGLSSPQGFGSTILDKTGVEKRTPPTPTPSPAPSPLVSSSGNATIHQQGQFIGGNVRVKTTVINPTNADMLQVHIWLNLPNVYRLLGVEPPEYARDGLVVNLNGITPGNEKEVSWIIEPLSCGKMQVQGTVAGSDAQGTYFTTLIAPLDIDVRCPLFVLPEVVPLPAVQQIFNEMPVKNERVYFLPRLFLPEITLNSLREVVSSLSVRFVDTIAAEESGKFNRTAWFYGITKYRKKRFVFTAGVSEKDRTIRISSACDEEGGCTGTLAEIHQGIARISPKIRELTCGSCGKTLPRGPDIGLDVTCVECGSVWTTANFER